MARIRPLVALALLFLWGIATVHCGLELDGLFGASLADASKASAGHDSSTGDTDPDGCGSIEHGCFEAHVGSLVLAQPAVIIEFMVVREALVLTTRQVSVPVAETTSPPPDLAPCWSFERRTSGESRAPALIG